MDATTYDSEMVSVYDPDGYEKIVTRAEAESMGERGEAVYCTPQLDDEINYDHWHRHERWPEWECLSEPT